MLKDVWDSFKDNIKERTTNPFLGTFAIVWIVHNWTVVYAFFYFDSDWKLDKKISYFNSYWSDKSFIGNLFSDALLAVCVLIITYCFLGLSRFLSNYFENVIIPFVHRLSNGRTVTFETHQNALKRIEALETKVEAERRAKVEVILERDELEKRVFAKSDENVSIEDYSDLIEQAKEKFRQPLLETTLLKISKQESFNNDPVIDFLLKHGLVVYTRGSSLGDVYGYTNEGDKFRRQYFRNTT